MSMPIESYVEICGDEDALHAICQAICPELENTAGPVDFPVESVTVFLKSLWEASDSSALYGDSHNALRCSEPYVLQAGDQDAGGCRDASGISLYWDGRGPALCIGAALAARYPTCTITYRFTQSGSYAMLGCMRFAEAVAVDFWTAQGEAVADQVLDALDASEAVAALTEGQRVTVKSESQDDYQAIVTCKSIHKDESDPNYVEVTRKLEIDFFEAVVYFSITLNEDGDLMDRVYSDPDGGSEYMEQHSALAVMHRAVVSQDRALAYYRAAHGLGADEPVGMCS